MVISDSALSLSRGRGRERGEGDMEGRGEQECFINLKFEYEKHIITKTNGKKLILKGVTELGKHWLNNLNQISLFDFKIHQQTQ